MTHNFETLEDVNKAIDVLHEGACLRAVVKINKVPSIANTKEAYIKVNASNKHFGGSLKEVEHWSKVNNCNMKFNIWIPDDAIIH